MRRPKTFGDIIGHKWLCDYLITHIQKGTLPHFLILEGLEGLGKTSLADVIALSLVYGLDESEERMKAYNDIVVNAKSNDYIKRFKCSEDGGKDAARIIKDEMNASFILNGRPKVIICDECHGLSDAAQDLFLAETEFISDRVYVILLTTEMNKLKASLRSRAVPLHLSPLKLNDMVTVLKKEADSRGLNIQHTDATLTMIAEWAECKPRTGLNILNAFADGESVSTSTIRELVGYLDVLDVLPLLQSLEGSMTFGLNFISEMTINPTLINIVVECINIKSGHASYKLKMSDISTVRDMLQIVPVERLVKFLYGLTSGSTLTRRTIINAYIGAHANFSNLVKESTAELLAVEDAQRANVEMEEAHEAQAKAPTLDDLLRSSAIIDN